MLDTRGMHVYFSGVGGVGIGPLAMLAIDAGLMVSGSDQKHSELLDYLRDRGARITLGQSGTEIAETHSARPIDWFVYTSALPADHPELVFAREHGIKTSKRDEFLNVILDEKKLSLIAVAGTHGKTTTTGMMIWALKQLSVPISYSIGTSISFGAPAEYVNGSDFFVYECDEFDKNFLSFHPYRAIIPSYDYDHPDTYPTRDDYKYAFLQFISQSRYVYLWQDDAKSLDLNDAPNITILTKQDPTISRLKLGGKVARYNAWLAAQCLSDLLPGVNINKIIEALNSFPGTNRRFELLAENLYTDYAHHPIEIAATIEMAKEISPNVVVVYQPHQNIRQHEILKEDGYQKCFEGAKMTYWLPTYLSREYQDLPVISPSELMASTSGETQTEFAEMNDALWHKIYHHIKDGDLVVCMSAGDLDHWLRNKVNGASTAA